MSNATCPLTELRAALGFASQASFAKAHGFDQSTISKWERGLAMPRQGVLRRLEKLAANTRDEDGEEIFTAAKMVTWSISQGHSAEGEGQEGDAA